MKKTRKKGFTIVELVIVIAVIAILAAVLIPTFSNVIGNAKVSAAQADAKNLWTQYCVDKAEAGFDTFNGCVKITKSGTDYFFAVTNGQISVTVNNEAPTIAGYTTQTGTEVTGYDGLYQYTKQSGG